MKWKFSSFYIEYILFVELFSCSLFIWRFSFLFRLLSLSGEIVVYEFLPNLLTHGQFNKWCGCVCVDFKGVWALSWCTIVPKDYISHIYVYIYTDPIQNKGSERYMINHQTFLSTIEIAIKTLKYNIHLYRWKIVRKGKYWFFPIILLVGVIIVN